MRTTPGHVQGMPQNVEGMSQAVGWRSCGSELLYLTVLATAMHFVVQQRVQGPVCALWAAQPTAATHSGSKGAAYTLLTDFQDLPSWSQQALCGRIWSADAGSKIPGLSTLSWAAGEALGFLWQPVLLAWVSRDPCYVLHLVLTPLLVAAIMWPAARRQQIAHSTRTATRAATRLLFLATSYMSIVTPQGLVQFHLPAVMASHGRWVLFVATAWMQGLLLQGFLCQPLLAAWISRDVHYLTHVIGATLLGAAVIWPTLHGVRVTLGTAARAATRLMFLATSSASTTRPAGLIHYHLQAVLASQGRWAVLTAMAWVQGVLLQVPPWLQLPLSMVEWWYASHDILMVQKTMGMAAPTWQQQLLEALLVVGVPWVPLLLQLAWQHAASKRPVHPATGQEQGCAGSQGVASSSGAGASKHLSPGDNNSSSGAIPGATDLKVQGTGVGTGLATTPSTARHTGCASTPVQPSSVSKDTSYCRSTPPASASVSSSSDSSSLIHQGPLAAVGADGSLLSGLQADNDSTPGTQVEHNPVLDMLQRLLQGHPLPAAAQLHAAAAAGALQLPHDMRYTPCTCMVPVSVKVPSPPGMSYKTAAARVMAAMGGEFNRQGPSGVLVHAMTTFPGCVLWRGEVVQAAGQHTGRGLQLARGQQQEQVGRLGAITQAFVQSLPALIRHVWLVPLATTNAPGPGARPGASPGAAATATNPAAAATEGGGGGGSPAPAPVAAAGAATQAGDPSSTWFVQGLPSRVTSTLQQELQGVLMADASQEMDPSSSRFNSVAQQKGQGAGTTGCPQAPSSAGGPSTITHQCAGPYTSCVVSTWGQPVTVALLDVEAGSSSGEAARAGGMAGQVGAYRVMVMHHDHAVMDEVVEVSYSSSTGGRSTCPSLTITCTRGQAGTPADSNMPAVVSVYLIPATDRTGEVATTTSSNSPRDAPPSAASSRDQACLPVAHVVVLLLPPEPAAELSGWVATQRLPLRLVAALGADLAVLVGCTDQLTAAAAAGTQPAAGLPAPAAGATQRLVSMSHLAIVAAGTLRPFLDAQGLVAASDLVAVLQQRVLVGATALQPMAAGHVVPAAPSAAIPTVTGTAVATRAVAQGWAMPGTERAAHQVPVLPVLRVSVTMAGIGSLGGTESQHSMSDAPAQQSGAGLSLPGHVRQASLAADAASTGSAYDLSTRSSSSSSSSNDSTSSSGDGGSNSGCELQHRALGGLTPYPAAHLPGKSTPGTSAGVPNTAATAAGCSKGATPAPCKAVSQHPILQLQPAEEAALTGSWWAALPLCWHGFRGVPGAECSYQAFRAAFLWRWDLGLRGYHFVVSLAMTAKALDDPQTMAALWGWGGLPVAICVAELAAHVLLLLAVPAWWGRHRDAVLATFHLRAGCIWIWQVLAWPPSLFRVVFGSGAQLLLVPVSLLLSPMNLWAGLLSNACVSPLTYTSLLLLSARESAGNAGLAALQAGVRASSAALVWGGMAFSLVNLSVVLLTGVVLEVAVRRAWLKQERQQRQEQQAALYCASWGGGGGAGPSY